MVGQRRDDTPPSCADHDAHAEWLAGLDWEQLVAHCTAVLNEYDAAPLPLDTRTHIRFRRKVASRQI